MPLLLWLLVQNAAALGPDAVEKALSGDLKGVEMKFIYHPGDPKEGTTTAISGDGRVVKSWSSDYSITVAEARTTEVLRLPLPKEDVKKILKLFASAAVLGLPRSDPRLVEDPKGPRTMRFTLAIRIEGIGAFEGEHPNPQYSKLPMVAEAKILIGTFQKSIEEHEKRIEQSDREFLSNERLAALMKDHPSALSIELHDSQALWGGTSLRLKGDGALQVLRMRPPRGGESGMQLRRFEGSVDAREAVAVLQALVERKTLEVRRKREYGIPDEVRPTFELRATLEGVSYLRTAWLWGGEAAETPEFQDLRQKLHILAERIAK